MDQEQRICAEYLHSEASKTGTITAMPRSIAMPTRLIVFSGLRPHDTYPGEREETIRSSVPVMVIISQIQCTVTMTMVFGLGPTSKVDASAKGRQTVFPAIGRSSVHVQLDGPVLSALIGLVGRSDYGHPVYRWTLWRRKRPTVVRKHCTAETEAVLSVLPETRAHNACLMRG